MNCTVDFGMLLNAPSFVFAELSDAIPLRWRGAFIDGSGDRKVHTSGEDVGLGRSSEMGKYRLCSNGIVYLCAVASY